MSRRGAPETPDGRYFVSRAQLWRMTDPRLTDADRRATIKAMMQARMALRRGDDAARAALDAAKVTLGEAGPVWWDDGAPDLSGAHPSDTPYAAWWQSLPRDVRERAEEDGAPG